MDRQKYSCVPIDNKYIYCKNGKFHSNIFNSPDCIKIPDKASEVESPDILQCWNSYIAGLPHANLCFYCKRSKKWWQSWPRYYSSSNKKPLNNGLLKPMFAKAKKCFFKSRSKKYNGNFQGTSCTWSPFTECFLEKKK